MGLRVMWLLNHSSARKFELTMLKRLGVNQIFLPKSYPADPSFRSASVDLSEDKCLDIPDVDLQVLNAADWYRGASLDAWHIANKHFDLIFLILHYPEVLMNAARYFSGAVLWRAYGLHKPLSYGHVVSYFNQFKSIEKIGSRFYFAEAYPHLSNLEPEYLKERRIYLPLGLESPALLNNWEGRDRQIYFVCPDIGFNPYYQRVYNEFRKCFANSNYVIAGAQPIHVNDPKVLGYVTNEQHAYNMAQSRVMFYHAQEPNHIHYHPFEAIRAGMPLVFMAGGMLDSMGGASLPGRCKTIAEARRKIERILADDWSFIERIRSSQTVLLDPMKPENCEPAWREGFARIELELDSWRAEQAARPRVKTHKRVAVILPLSYRGGSLRGAVQLAKALYTGSRKWGEDADVVFIHLDDPNCYPDEEFADFPDSIARRPFSWKTLPAAEARRAMRYAGFQGWEPSSDNYIVPDDGVRQLVDCDLWLIVSDRLSYPVLPLKPIVLMVYDYLQRYEDLLSHGADIPFLYAARTAEKVLVTTEFTRQDALQYAGVEARKVSKVPMLAPEFSIQRSAVRAKQSNRPYFIWTTNAAPHKNHRHAAEALKIYYEELNGQWDCRVTGVNTKEMLSSKLPHLRCMAELFERSKSLRKRVKWMGELPDTQYRRLLAQASFLWHAGRIDNGTFSVIEAACVGVPSLSSDYPAMREIDIQFSLNLVWMNHDSPRNMAEQLKRMELEAMDRRDSLPTEAQLHAKRLERNAGAYWQEIRECL